MNNKQPDREIRRRKRVNSSPHSTGWLFFLLVCIMGITIFQSVGWMKEIRMLNDKKAAIERKIEKEKFHTQQLFEYKEYMKTDEYIEDIAGSDLGMVYDGEVLFKEDHK